ncbi:hypothetical protein PCLA_05f0060 [Pseudomonas citronellolis]|nr:hypothetical protein PCLA_05f0060 [Pseudomonas citronellolis]
MTGHQPRRSALRRSELARERRFPVVPVYRAGSAPLPNPLPEGRGDCSAYWGYSTVSRQARSIRRRPFLPLARTSPLSLQGEGWGEGALAPGTEAPGSLVREQARSYEKPCPPV